MLWKAAPWLVVVGLALFAFALEIAIVGVVPGVSDPERVLAVCWSAVLGVLACMGLALVGASAELATNASIRRPVETAAAGSR